MHGHRNGESLERERLPFHREVAVGVPGRRPDDTHVYRKGVIEQALRTAHRHKLDEILGGSPVELAATVAWIDESSQSDLGDMAGTVGRDVAKQMGDNALREVVGFYLVGNGQLLKLRHQAP